MLYSKVPYHVFGGFILWEWRWIQPEPTNIIITYYNTHTSHLVGLHRPSKTETRLRSRNPSPIKANTMNRADPNDKLVSHLVTLGYTPSQISHAQETLWNTIGSGEGGYDDADAVEGLLRQLYRKEEESSSSGSEYETDSEEEEGGEQVKGESSGEY